MMLEVLCGLRILSVSSVAPSGASHIPVFEQFRFTCSGQLVPVFLLTAIGWEVFVSLGYCRFRRF
ncbi:hypothetical protein Bca4012_027467 [Brassica carinata]